MDTIFCFPPHAIRIHCVIRQGPPESSWRLVNTFLADVRVSRTIVWGAYGFWVKVKPFFGFVISCSFV